MPEISNLVVAIGYDDSAVTAGVGKTSQTVSGLGSTIQTALGAAAVGAVAGLGAAFVGSVKTAADFEKQLSAISAVSGATASQLDGIRAVALQLGKDTSFSASEAAAGMEEMVKAGVSLSDVMGGAGRAALDLAAAGGLSVAESATIASNAMNVFSLKGSDMAHVADVIAGAANASAIDVHDFGFSLSAVGAVAATVGLSMEDTATSIAVLGQAGLKGADAGTSLKTMLLNLNPASKAARSEMKALGLITADGANQFFDATGKVKSMSEVAQILQNSMKGLTKEQQINALQVAFGTDAIRAAAIMAKAGAAGFNEMADAESKVTAQAVANERLNNLAGSIEMLKGSLETGAIILGSMFTPALKGMADAMTSAVNTAVDDLQQIPDVIATVQQVIAGDWAPDASIHPFTNAVGEAAVMIRDTFGPAISTVAGFISDTLIPAVQQFAAPIGAFVAGFTGAIAAAGVFSAVAAGIAAVLGLLLSPLGLVAIAVGLLAAAWTTDFMGIQETTAAWWAVLQPILAQAVDWLQVQLGAALTWLTTTGWPMMVAAGQAVSDWITTVGIPAFTALVDWLGPKISAVVTWISETGWPALVTAGIAVSDWITSVAIPAFTSLVDWLGPKITAVVTWLSDTGWPALVTAGTAVGTMVDAVIKFFTDLFTALEQRGVFTDLGTIWGTLTGIGNTLWELLGKLFTVIGTVITKFNDAKAAVDTLVAAAVLPALVGLFGGVADKATAAGGPVQILADAIKTFFGVISSQLLVLQKFLDMLNTLSNFKMPSFNFSGGGGGGGGFGTQTLSYRPGGGGGGNPDDAVVEAYIRQQANAYKVDPDMAVAVWSGEGRSGYVGDSGSSFGPYQLHMGNIAPGGNAVGGMGDSFMAQTGLDPRDSSTWREQVDYVLRNQHQTGWTPFHGAPASATNPAMMQRIPLKGGTGTGAPGASPADWPGFMQQVNEQLPDYLTSLDTIQQSGVGTFGAVAQGAVASGAALVSASTDSLGNVTRIYSENGVAIGATITDTAGQIVNAWGTMGTGITEQTALLATGVTEQTNLMATGALTSVTALGTGTLTTVQTTAGTTIATVTDMTGQVTSQYATLANGAQLSMDGLAAGVLTSTTDLGTGVLTIVADMSGNTIATITDMSGQVTSQYAGMAGAATEMASTTSAQFGAVGKAADATQAPIKHFDDTVKGLKPPDLSGFVSEFNKVTSAANKAADAIATVNGKGGSKGGKSDGGSNIFAKAAGGPVDFGQTYLVGEQGPELFSPRTSGTIIPHGTLMGGGGQTTVINVEINGSLVAERDLDDVIAGAVSRSLRSGSSGLRR